MRVLYHHRTQGRGVEAVHIRGLVRALRRRGHLVKILSPPGCDPFKDVGSRKAQSNSKPLWNLISAKVPELVFELLELCYNFYAVINLGLAARSYIIYERYFLFSITACVVARLRDCRLIYEINDSSFLERRVRKLVLVGLARAIERWVLTRADLVVAVSASMASTLEKLVGVNPRKILVLPNAVESAAVVESIQPATGSGSGEVVVGFVGLFVPWHGLDLLLDAMADLIGTGAKARILLVGDGPVRFEVERRAAQLGLTDRITVTGTVPHSEVPAWIDRMDVAVLPDSNDYGSPMKIFEYMARGRAVVAPDYGPVLEVLRDGSNGVIFPRRDSAALRNALAKLIGNPELRLRLGENAREYVLHHHTWDRKAEMFENAVTSIADRTSSSNADDI